ncbi:hypothetical protein Q8A67_001665 [Cirrhinus molitorella]|uniref:BTB domain-containing protein n=1 Tax=Cirrhinus molitorella TaxID=172907 RepID=A0AA88Q6S9_9TELE|nr:hypothetical protein Q8A67_001665 [Cirrhinus molitorella]
MAIDQQCLQREWRSSWRSREDENMSSDNGWMDASKEEEGEENPGEEDERTEEEDSKELHVNAQESEKTVDEDEGCSVGFSFMPAQSDSVFAMCTNKDSDEEDVSKYDNNNIDAVCSSSFPVSNGDYLVDAFTNDASDDTDKYDDEYSVCFSTACASGERLIAACTNNEKSGTEDNADKYDDKNSGGEYSNSLPVAFANSDCLVAAINNDKTSDEEDANEKDGKEFIVGFTVTSANNEGLVASLTNNDEIGDDNSGHSIQQYVDINSNEEYIKSSPDISANGVTLDAQNDKSTDKDYNENASISTENTGHSETDFTFGDLTSRDEEQHMNDSSSEQELINQESEEEDDDYDDDEYNGSSSFEDSEYEDPDMHPKKLYSDPAYPVAVFQALENMMLYSVLTDLFLFTEDGYQFQVHSFVLAAVSYLIQTRIRQKPKQEQFISLCLGPEVHGSGLAAVVDFAYTGNIGNLNKGNIEWIWSAAVSLEVPRILELCKEVEEREENEAKGKKVDSKEISAEEHMKISLQHIRQMWTQRMGCDVELEAEGRVFYDCF